jgi:hypothetical protein
MVSDCVVEQNAASGYGGGIYFSYGGTAVCCSVSSNWAGSGGGGVNGNYGGTIVDSTVVSNRTASNGGGVYLYRGGVADRCAVLGNEAGLNGGGCYLTRSSSGTGEVANCLVYANTSGDDGGGIFFHGGGRAAHSTIVGNTAADAGEGGGVYGNGGGNLQNSIVYFNAAGSDSNYNSLAFVSFDHCCTAPYPGLPGNIADAPGLVNLAAGNCRLQYGSPCIDKGMDVGGAATHDLDRAPRPVDGDFDNLAEFDMGCYEYGAETADSNEDGVPDGWYLQYAMDPLQTGLASGNPDLDPHTTGQEYLADTNPTNAASYFTITAVSNPPPVTVYFHSSSNRLYTLQGMPGPAAGPWQDAGGAARVPGSGGLDGLSDTNGVLAAGWYRVGVSLR